MHPGGGGMVKMGKYQAPPMQEMVGVALRRRRGRRGRKETLKETLALFEATSVVMSPQLMQQMVESWYPQYNCSYLCCY